MKFYKIPAAIVFVLLLSSCSANNTRLQAVPKPVEKQPSTLSIEQRKLYINSKLAAESAVRQQQYEIATSKFLIAARLVNSIELAEKAVHYAERIDDHIASIQAAQFWSKIAPQDQIALSWKILGQFRSHQNSQLQLSLQSLFSLTRNNPDGHFLKTMENVTIMVADSSTQKQIQIFAENNKTEPEVWLVLARLMEQLQQKDKAMSYIDKALSINKKFVPAYELKGGLLLRSGETLAAQDFLIKSVDKFPKELALKQQLAQLYYQQSNYTESVKLANQILESDSTSNSARYLLAAIYFIQEKYVLSEVQFLVLLDEGYRRNTVYYFLGEINREISKKSIAVQFFDAVNGGRNLARSRVNAAVILAEEDQLEEAIKRLRNVRVNDIRDQVFLASTEIKLLKNAQRLEKYKPEILKAFSRNPTNIYVFTRAMKISDTTQQRQQLIQLSLNAAQTVEVYKGLVEIAFGLTSQLGDYNLALSTLDEYLRQFSDDATLLYSRAMLKAQLNDIKGMDQDLKTILRLEPDHTDALNALGYSLADQNLDLDKAYQMILTAFNKRPNSAAIIDSLGWVLYRKGEYNKSLDHLKKAWEQEPSAEVGAHLGEVLWITDSKESARSIWEQAQKLDSKNKVLIDTIKRLKQ